MRIGLFLVAVVLVSCSPPVEEMDAGVKPTRDAGVRRDAGIPDAGEFDAGPPPCIDNDNDGRGENCPFPDCDDTNQMISVTLMGFRDADSDMATVGAAVQVCTSGTLPNTYRAMASAVPDCDDADPARTVLRMGYLDMDGDGVTVGGAVPFCTGGTLPTNYQPMASALPDCDDMNDAKYISQTGFVDADGDMATIGARLTFCTNGPLPAGHRAMASAVADCNDMNASIFLPLTGFLDTDGDQFTVGSAVMLCTAGMLPSNYRPAASATPDCDDASPARFSNVTGYADLDWDGVTVASSTTLCGAGVLPPGYAVARTSLADCDDTNAGISPFAPELADDGVDNDCGGGDVTHTSISATSTGFYVDSAGCSGTPSGGASAPFCEISDAVNAIDNSPTGFGTIFVSAGSYGGVFIPRSVDITILGGYRNVGGTWTRNITANTARIRAITTDTSFNVGLQVTRLIVDGLSIEAPFESIAYALQSSSPMWLSRVTMIPNSGNPTAASTGVRMSANTTIVGSRIQGFTRKAIDFTGNAGQQVRVFNSQLGVIGGSASTTIVDLGALSGGGVLKSNQLTSSTGTDAVGVRTPRAPAETTLVANTIELLSSTASSTWLNNEGFVTALGNRFTGASNTVGCVGVRTVASSGQMSRTTLAGNLIYVQSLSTNCVGVRVSSGTAELAHNIVRVAGTTNSDGIIVDGTATTTTLLNNVFMSTRAITPSASSQISAYGNLFDSTIVNTLVVGASTVINPPTFNACTWQGCVGAGVTKYAQPLFTNLGMGDYTLQDSSVCLNGGADPAKVNLSLIPIFAYAPNGPRPVGVGYDIGMFER